MNSSSRDHDHTTGSALEWQPIESAPTGKLVIAREPELGYLAIVFQNHQNEWECVDYARNPMGVGFYPTEWRPLLEPPSSAKPAPGESSRDDP